MSNDDASNDYHNCTGNPETCTCLCPFCLAGNCSSHDEKKRNG